MAMRIVSLLPSATEILFALGLGDQVVGVTHECDYPPEVREKKILTRCIFDAERLSQSEIDQQVRSAAEQGRSLYEIDDAALMQAKPDLIITQELCHVCAITPQEVDRAVSRLPVKPQVISLNPKVLEDVFSDIMLIAHHTGVEAKPLVERLHERVKKVARAALTRQKPKVACIEWLDPLWRTGHWVPVMVELAGGIEVLAQASRPSRPVSWEELVQSNPEIVILMPCGYTLERTRKEFERVQTVYPWEDLPACQNSSIYLVDANAYFSRSGPRLVEGLELLAEMLHPEYFTNLAPLHSYIRISDRR